MNTPDTRKSALKRRCAALYWMLLMLAGLSACSFSFANLFRLYDSSFLTIQSLSLFDQKITIENHNWEADWLLRRLRLSVIDKVLWNEKPDIIVLQDVVRRTASDTDFDLAILGDGSLRNFSWNHVFLGEKNSEIEETGLAIGSNVSLKKVSTEETYSTLITPDSFITHARFLFEGQDILVFNVQIPRGSSSKNIVNLENLLFAVMATAQSYNICRDRIIIAGQIPLLRGQFQNSIEILTKYGLKDTNEGFCDVENNCNTLSRENSLATMVHPEFKPMQWDRILVANSAKVRNASRNFDTEKVTSTYLKQINIPQIFPVPTFGWVSHLKLARCSN